MPLIVPEEIIKEYLRLRNMKDGLVPSKEYYFLNIMPFLRDHVEQDPQHRALGAEHFEGLISLMGYSVETTVLTSVILRPKRLVVAYSENAAAVANIAFNYLTREGIIEHTGLDAVAVNAFDPEDIYRKLVQRIPQSTHRVFDITGGTKVMSATAGHLAWDKNLSLCYLNGDWNPNSGSAGLESASRLKLIFNPSQHKGYEVRRAALEHFEKGNFAAARESLQASLKLIDDYTFEDFAIALCNCYCTFADLDRESLASSLNELSRLLDRRATRSIFEGQIEMDAHVAALRRLAQGERLAITAAFLELIEVYRKQSRFDFACLLAYRAMESLVEIGLRGQCSGFDPNHPDYSLLTAAVPNLEQQYVELAKPEYRTLPDRVGMAAGFALLCLVRDTHLRFARDGRERDPLRSAVYRVRGLAKRRNSSVLAHGAQSLQASDCAEMTACAEDMAKAVLDAESLAELTRLRADIRPRPLRDLRFRRE